jgi:hypothetical protein
VRRVSSSGFCPFIFSIVTAIVINLCSGCGGGNNGNSVQAPLTTVQINAMSLQVANAFVASTNQMTSDLCPMDASKPFQSYYCTIPVATNVTYNGGGSASLTGFTSGNIDEFGGQTVPAIAFVPTNLGVPGTTLVMTGDPNLMVTGLIEFYYGPVGDFDVTETGSVTYGPTPSGVCPMVLTTYASFNGDAQHSLHACTVTGTACGQTINLGCM